MNGLPYYKAYPRDFVEGTVGMPFDLKAAYRIVLDLIYMQNGKLPDDPRYISGLLGCSTRAWNRYRQQLISLGKIYAENGIISNFRADKELESLRTFQDNQREKASKPRKIKDIDVAPVKPEPSHTEPDTYKERDTNVSPKKITPRMVLERVLDKDRAEAVLDHRQKLRKPMTVRAAEMMASKLAECEDPNGAADLMIERGWQSVNPDWVRNASQSTPSRANQSPRRETAADVLFNLAERMDNAERSEDDRKAIGFVPSIVNGRA